MVTRGNIKGNIKRDKRNTANVINNSDDDRAEPNIMDRCGYRYNICDRSR